MSYRIPLLFSFWLLLAACSGSENHSSAAKSTAAPTQWEPPAPGTKVAQYEARVREDNLNEKYFRVTVLATEASKEGSFNLKLEFGYNINETDIQLPQWTPGVVLKPLLQKAEGTYHCLLGFDAGDGVFHELYDIQAENGNVRMKQTKGYFQSQ